MDIFYGKRVKKNFRAGLICLAAALLLTYFFGLIATGGLPEDRVSVLMYQTRITGTYADAYAARVQEEAGVSFVRAQTYLDSMAQQQNPRQVMLMLMAKGEGDILIVSESFYNYLYSQNALAPLPLEGRFPARARNGGYGLAVTGLTLSGLTYRYAASKDEMAESSELLSVSEEDLVLCRYKEFAFPASAEKVLSYLLGNLQEAG